MLTQYKTKKCSTKTAKANEMRAQNKPKKEIVEDSSDSSDSESSSGDEYEEILLRASEGYQKVPESKPEPENKPKPEIKSEVKKEPEPVKEVPNHSNHFSQSDVKKKPKKPKKKRKTVIKNYYINKPEPKPEKIPGSEERRRVSYIGLGAMPMQSTSLRNRIINF